MSKILNIRIPRRIQLAICDYLSALTVFVSTMYSDPNRFVFVSGRFKAAARDDHSRTTTAFQNNRKKKDRRCRCQQRSKKG
jgi:hypothetical protein